MAEEVKKEFKFCEHCGAKMNIEADFCKECGKLVKKPEAPKTTSNADTDKWWAALAYVIAPIPYFVKKDSEYVHFHSKIGMNVFCVNVAWVIISVILGAVIKISKPCYTFWGVDYGTCSITPWWVSLITWLGSVAISVFAVWGIVYALQGKKKKIPLFSMVNIFK